ncbi:hypothetical protein CDO73_13480 [Saccharibacillus sp. O23]|nr:hypothetical protein CDO73_13480 [Saccharibacillus sp. O23]
MSALAGAMLCTAVPAFAADNPDAAQQQAAFPDNDIRGEAKTALLKEALALDLGLEENSGTIDETQRRKGLDLAEQAVTISADGLSSASEVAQARKKVKEAANKLFMSRMDSGAHIKFYIQRLTDYVLTPAANPTAKYPQEAIDSAVGKLKALDARVPIVGLEPEAYMQAYMEYLSIRIELDMQAYMGTYITAYIRTRDHVNAQIERTKDIDEDYSNLLEAFRTRSEILFSRMGAARGEAELAYIFNKMNASYFALTEAFYMLPELRDARLLLDSPRGNRPGQYPASAVGTLRREVNAAARALDQARMQDDVYKARKDLSSAVAEFRSRLIP